MTSPFAPPLIDFRYHHCCNIRTEVSSQRTNFQLHWAILKFLMTSSIFPQNQQFYLIGIFSRTKNRRKLVDPSMERYYQDVIEIWWIISPLCLFFADVSTFWAQFSEMASHDVMWLCYVTIWKKVTYHPLPNHKHVCVFLAKFNRCRSPMVEH